MLRINKQKKTWLCIFFCIVTCIYKSTQRTCCTEPKLIWINCCKHIPIYLIGQRILASFKNL